MKVCINYLVKPEKIQTFLSDLSRAAYLNFRRMGRGFSFSRLFLSLEKYFKYLFSLFWDKAVTKNWRAGFWASFRKERKMLYKSWVPLLHHGPMNALTRAGNRRSCLLPVPSRGLCQHFHRGLCLSGVYILTVKIQRRNFGVLLANFQGVFN